MNPLINKPKDMPWGILKYSKIAAKRNNITANKKKNKEGFVLL